MGASLFDYPLKLIVFYTLLQAFPFMSKIYQMKVIPEKIESFFTKLMDDAIKLRVDSKIERDDYLNYMIQLSKKKKLKHIELAAHTVTFFLDGYETSSNVISHVLYQLARHSEVQKRLRQDIQESIAENNGVTYESMHEMTYLDQVFQGELLNTHTLNFDKLIHREFFYSRNFKNEPGLWTYCSKMYRSN